MIPKSCGLMNSHKVNEMNVHKHKIPWPRQVNPAAVTHRSTLHLLHFLHDCSIAVSLGWCSCWPVHSFFFFWSRGHLTLAATCLGGSFSSLERRDQAWTAGARQPAPAPPPVCQPLPLLLQMAPQAAALRPRVSWASTGGRSR